MFCYQVSYFQLILLYQRLNIQKNPKLIEQKMAHSWHYPDEWCENDICRHRHGAHHDLKQFSWCIFSNPQKATFNTFIAVSVKKSWGNRPIIGSAKIVFRLIWVEQYPRRWQKIFNRQHMSYIRWETINVNLCKENRSTTLCASPFLPWELAAF